MPVVTKDARGRGSFRGIDDLSRSRIGISEHRAVEDDGRALQRQAARIASLRVGALVVPALQQKAAPGLAHTPARLRFRVAAIKAYIVSVDVGIADVDQSAGHADKLRGPDEDALIRYPAARDIDRSAGLDGDVGRQGDICSRCIALYTQHIMAAARHQLLNRDADLFRKALGVD